MKTRNRLLCLVLVLTMILAMVPAAGAETVSSTKELYYQDAIMPGSVLSLDGVAFGLGSSIVLKPYSKDGDTETALTGGTMKASPEAVAISYNEMSGAYEIKAVSVSENVVITYTVGEEVYSATVSTSLPVFGLYSDDYVSDETFLRQITSEYINNADNEVWFLTPDGFVSTDVVTFTASNGKDVEATPTLIPSVGENIYGYKLTLPDPGEGGYTLSANINPNDSSASSVSGEFSTLIGVYSNDNPDSGDGPPVGGFYTETSTTAVTTAEYSIESGLTLYYKTADGYAEDQLQNLSVEINRKQIEGLTVEKVLHGNSTDKYDIKIVIPSGLGMYKEGNILQLNGSNFGNYITLTCNDGLSQNPDGSSPSLLAEFDVDGTAYAIGFVGYNGNDKVLRDDVGIGQEVFDGGPKTIINNLEISAGEKKTSGGETNYPAIDVDESILRWKVTKLYIADMNGTGTFSFDDEESKTSLTNLDDNKDMPDVYGLDYSFNTSKVVAELDVYINGATDPQKAVIYIGIGQMVVSSDVVERPEDDNVDELNAWLASNNTEGVVLIKLGKEYNGTIQIPEGVNRYKFVGHEDCTIIKGGINLNGGSTTISARENIDIPNKEFSYGAIHFVAPDSNNNGNVTSAIFGGSSSTVNDCTFYGYDVAVDCSGGLITLENYNIFVNNEVAVRIDLKSATNKSYNQGTWMRNTFLNNETAIKIVSLNDEIISPFEFRVSYCNFIHNAVDVDAEVKGTFYFYDNYYGRRKDIDFGQKHGKNGHGLDVLNLTGMLGAKSDSERTTFYEDSYERVNQTIDRETFNKQIKGDATIIISRASEKPIKGWWRMCNHLNHHPKGERPQPNSENQIALLSSDEEYSDNYIAIWTVETEIINKDADNLVMDGSSFVDSQGEPVETEVAVVEADKTSSVLLGTWIFGKTITENQDDQTYIVSNSTDDSTKGFNAKLTINRTNDEITVEVVDSTVLETLKPLLTVPCDFDYATVTCDSEEVDSVLDTENDVITFVVEKGGEYVITKGEAPDDDTTGDDTTDDDDDTSGGGTTDRPVIPGLVPGIMGGIADIILGGGADIIERPVSGKTDIMDTLLALDTLENYGGSKSVFSDVAETDWFYGEVTSLVKKGVVNGYPDGTFRPYGEVTWGEALKLVMKAVGYGDIAATGDHWASGYMDMAKDKGLIPGEVELNAAISRGEMADLTAKAMKLGAAKGANPFDDEAPESAVALYEAGIIKGSADNGQLLYRAESTIIRAEMAAIIWRVYCAR